MWWDVALVIWLQSACSALLRLCRGNSVQRGGVCWKGLIELSCEINTSCKHDSSHSKSSASDSDLQKPTDSQTLLYKQIREHSEAVTAHLGQVRHTQVQFLPQITEDSLKHLLFPVTWRLIFESHYVHITFNREEKQVRGHTCTYLRHHNLLFCKKTEWSSFTNQTKLHVREQSMTTGGYRGTEHIEHHAVHSG